MKSIAEILRDYTEGAATAAQANEALRSAGAGFSLTEGRNVLTPEELDETIAGGAPEEVTGWGLLDTGTGTLDKVRVESGKLVDADCGEMYALCLIGGKTYHVRGDQLEE